MTIIRTIPESEAEGTVAELYADDVDALGYVASYTKAMAMNVGAYRAFESLVRSVAKPLGLRRYELVTLAAARGAKSRHCRLAHGVKSLKLFDEEQLEEIARDYTRAGLGDAEVEMMRFAEQVGRDASAMTDTDSQRLREVGFSDQEIVDIAIAASVRVYFASALQALGVEVDQPPMLAAPLREALLEGLDRA
jgi:alkylhydroperoxidase family enzyme